MDNDFIDLCDSFILAHHDGLADLVIELDSDDSFRTNTDDCLDENFHPNTSSSTCGQRTLHSVTDRKLRKRNTLSQIDCKQKKISAGEKKVSKVSNRQSITLGDCPICFDQLGLNPLASTKCGHVYCMKCLKQHLITDKRCPTCRTILKGTSSYHHIYLSQ